MLRPYKGPVIIAGLLVVVWTLTVVAGPLIVRYAIDNGLSEGEVGPLNTAIVAYLAVAVVAYVVARLQIMSIGRIGEGFLRDLRVRVFDHLQSLSLGFFEKEKAGVLVSRRRPTSTRWPSSSSSACSWSRTGCCSCSRSGCCLRSRGSSPWCAWSLSRSSWWRR